LAGAAFPGTVNPEKLKVLASRIFVRAGMAEEHAALVAEVLVWADLRGMASHGVMRVPRYVELIRSGDMNARPHMKLVGETAATAHLDADRAAGPVAMTRAAALAIEKARQAGIGLALARSTTHTAALGYYTQLGARAGMATIALAASGPNMAYHGARAAGVSTAPLSIAVPGGHEPLALDMGSGVVSLGKLMQARRTGEALAPGLALDAQGSPTTDARRASIPLPLGGAKGSGLALMLECLASLVSGNPILAEALEGTPAGRRHTQNGLVIAIDIERFLPLDSFTREIERLKQDLKALPPQPGAEILMPGERGSRNAAARQNDVPIAPALLEELRAVGRSLGVASD
jgi:LDH2 family malate/lactate/ureidoglycolate dehydrogenase